MLTSMASSFWAPRCGLECQAVARSTDTERGVSVVPGRNMKSSASMILANPHISIRQRSSFFLLNADSLNWGCADGIWKSRCLAARLNVDFDSTEAKLAGVDGRFEGGHNHGIKFGASQCSNAVHGVVQFHRRLIRAVGGHGVESISHSDDARHQRNLLPLQSVGITAAVHVFVVQ